MHKKSRLGLKVLLQNAEMIAKAEKTVRGNANSPFTSLTKNQGRSYENFSVGR